MYAKVVRAQTIVIHLSKHSPTMAICSIWCDWLWSTIHGTISPLHWEWKQTTDLLSFFLKHWKNLFFRCFVTIRPQAFKSLSSSILLPQVNATIRSPIQDLVPNGTKVPKWSHKRPNFACKSQIQLNLPNYMLWDVFRPHALLRVYNVIFFLRIQVAQYNGKNSWRS